MKKKKFNMAANKWRKIKKKTFLKCGGLIYTHIPIFIEIFQDL